MSAIIVTSISAPNAALHSIAGGAKDSFIVCGDEQSPKDFALPGCRFLSIEDQIATGFRLATICPTRVYARKNIGYLVAIAEGAKVIVETDDDNFPRRTFFEARDRRVIVPVVDNPGWINTYRYFTDSLIWPRGLPLDTVLRPVPLYHTLTTTEVDCPIQQGLADENPDVDAIYRLLFPLPQSFRRDRRIALDRGSWCPFNSQNTTWWDEAFPLMYLPAYCSFRMSDIWRSLVAQRIGWERGWRILFHEPTVWQERNAHNLMRDFEGEAPGHLHNDRIRVALEATPMTGNLLADLRVCYETLIKLEIVPAKELQLVDAWIEDIEGIKS